MDLVVPNYQESSSVTYPSTCMWGGWSMNSPEASEKCFDYDSFSGGGFLNSQMSMKTSEEESKMSKTFYSASSFEDFEGIDQMMDDIFLSSMLEDVPRNDIFMKEEAPFSISDLSEENMLDSHYGDVLSSEELVLQDLQRASEKLTDETRKCFRDIFYRLARNSHEKSDSDSSNSEELLLHTATYDHGDGTRLSGEEGMGSEANSIDRAIANLTFNKMEFNICNFPLSERVQ